MGAIKDIVYFEDGSILACGDYRDVLSELYSNRTALPCFGRADTVITDPPYGTTGCHWDNPIDWKAFWNLMQDINELHTTYVMFCSGSFVPVLMNSNLPMYKYDMVWEKTTNAGFLNACWRPLVRHEKILVFLQPGQSKKAVYNRYGDSQDVKFMKYRCNKNSYCHIYGKQKITYTRTRCLTAKCASTVCRGYDLTKLERKIHSTCKPVSLLQKLVQIYSNPGGLVIDIFAGSGTTALACKMTGRKFITIERDKEIFEIAKARLQSKVILVKCKNKLQKTLFDVDNTHITIESSNAHN